MFLFLLFLFFFRATDAYGDGIACPVPTPFTQPPPGYPSPTPAEQVKKRQVIIGRDDCATSLMVPSASCEADFTGSQYCCNLDASGRRGPLCYDGTPNTGCMSCNDRFGACVSSCTLTKGCVSMDRACEPIGCENKIVALVGATCTW